MTIPHDKTMGCKALLGLVLAFWQFCQGLCLSGYKVGNVSECMSNVKG